jgi:hypothetical protein
MDVEKLRAVFQIENKLKGCQKSAKFVCGEKYEQTVTAYADLIKKVCKERQIEPLQAVLIMAKLPTFEENGTASMMLIAAAVEVLENPKFQIK